MLKIGQCGMGDWMGRHTAVFWNRTGAAILRSEVAMVDLLDTQAEVTAGLLTEGDELSIWASTTPVTDALLESGFPAVVALEDIADNARGRFLLWGKVEVSVLDDDVSTTDIDRGERIQILTAEADSGTPGALTTGGAAVQSFVTGATRVLGIALEDAAATSADTDRLIDVSAHRRWCFWWGGVPGYGVSDT